MKHVGCCSAEVHQLFRHKDHQLLN